MAEYSEDLAKIEILEYLDSCVEAQPEWVRELFRIKRAFFVMSKDVLAISFKKRVKQEERNAVVELLSTYMADNPSKNLDRSEMPNIH